MSSQSPFRRGSMPVLVLRPAVALRAVISLAVLALLLGGCGTDADFDNAARANTAGAWDEYLRAHPDGPHAREARERLGALQEDREWQRAHAADTADAYQRYVRSYPQGAHVHDALVAITHLNLAAAPAREPPPAPAADAVAGSITPAAPTAPPPAAGPPPQPAPASRTTPLDRYHVQLGAFAGGSGGAARAWRSLTERYPELAARTPVIVAGRAADGSVIDRLQIAGFERPAAEALCASLATHHDPCVLVAPPKAEPVTSR